MHTLRLDNIPGTYLCSIPVRNIRASCPWHISLHSPGRYPCIIPLGQSYPCQMGPHTMRLDHIPGTCLSHMSVRYICFLSQAHFPAYPWDIFLHYTIRTIISLPNGIPHNGTKPYPWEISFLHICATYTCFSSLAHFPAYPWDTLYPRDNHIPAKWNTSVSHLLKFKKNVSNASGLRITRFEFYG